MRLRQVLVDGEVGRGGDGDEEVVGDAVLQVVFILNALEAVCAFGYFVLTFERCTGAAQRRCDAKVASMQRDGFRRGRERLRRVCIRIAKAGTQAAASAEDGGAGLGIAAAGTTYT